MDTKLVQVVFRVASYTFVAFYLASVFGCASPGAAPHLVPCPRLGRPRLGRF
jgi:hypothetical protein